MPAAIQCVPVDGPDGDVAAVVSILDRAEGAAGPAAPAVPIEQITDLVGSLIRSANPSAGDLARRLDGLAPPRRTSAITAISALLDALER